MKAVLEERWDQEALLFPAVSINEVGRDRGRRQFAVIGDECGTGNNTKRFGRMK